MTLQFVLPVSPTPPPEPTEVLVFPTAGVSCGRNIYGIASGAGGSVFIESIVGTVMSSLGTGALSGTITNIPVGTTVTIFNPFILRIA
jgi:hypothetical protein